jgi:opacity protein-like surface antigen
MKIKTTTTALTITAIMTLSSLSLTAAAAQDKSAFDGAYTGFGLSLDRFSGSHTANGTTTDFTKKNRGGINLYTGYGFTKDTLYFGLEAGFTFNRSAKFDLTGQANIFNAKNTIDLSARAGFTTGEALVYGLAGYSNTKFNIQSGATTDSKRLSAFRFGGGMEIAFMKQGRLRLEYSRANYGEWKYKLQSVNDPVFKPKSDRFMASLSWSF